MSLLACISRWPDHHALAVVLELARTEELLEHRRLGLLHLQEQRIPAVAPQHQRDPGARADAADAHHLAREVDEPELLEQQLALVRTSVPRYERSSVVQPLERLLALLARSRGRAIGTISGGSATIRRSPSTTRVSLEKADMLSRVRALARLFSVRLAIFAVICEPSSPSAASTSRCEYHTSRFFIAAKLAIAVRYSSDGVEHCPVLVLDRVAVVLGGDQHARRQALDVPLPGTRQRLVEVVEVEHQPPLGRGEHAEVRQVRVAATLHLSGPIAA